MNRKEVKGLGMPWEDEFGYAQAVKVDDIIYISGQLSHDDEGNMVPPPSKPAVAGTILVTPRLALPEQLVEIKFVAQLRS